MKKQALLLVAVLVGALVMIDHAVAQRPDGGGRGRGNRGERQRPEHLNRRKVDQDLAKGANAALAAPAAPAAAVVRVK